MTTSTLNHPRTEEQPRRLKSLEQLKSSTYVTYCEVFGVSRRRSMAQVQNYHPGWH
eukprot:04227.XXX_120599_120766_1 [CDS] Oithona nana genome sequencing.